MEIGAQLYTVREFCQTTEGIAETLKKVADIGYRTVQVSGTCPFDPDWLNNQLKQNGLECVITHTPAPALRDNPADAAQAHSVFGCNYIGLGYYPFNQDVEGERLEDFIRMYSPVADTLYENGKRFMFHNHDREFQRIDGKVILQHLADSFAPEKLGFVLDSYWIQVGGGDTADWIERLSGRVPCIHLKDYAFGAKMAVLGEGNLNFDRIFAAAEKSGTEYMLVEQDDCGGEDPFECLGRSYEYLKARGFE